MIYSRNPGIVALAEATSANGAARNGATLPVEKVGNAGLLVACVAKITTASVVATFKAQVSDDGTVWYDLKLPNNASNVSTAAGTGTEVITRVALDIPPSIFGMKLFRVVATLSGAATASADVTSAAYRFVNPGGLRGRT
jgi:hypothetical protein